MSEREVQAKDEQHQLQAWVERLFLVFRVCVCVCVCVCVWLNEVSKDQESMNASMIHIDWR